MKLQINKMKKIVRIQKIQKSPDIIFDVAHNSQSIDAFITYFHKHRPYYKKSFLIIGFELIHFTFEFEGKKDVK